MENDILRPWSPYIQLSDALTQEQRAAVIETLDQIAAFRDGEGMELLRAAFDRNGSNPLTLTPTESGSSYNAETGILSVGFDQSRQLRINGERPSLTATLVHELYHASDNKDDLLAQSRATLLDIAGLDASDPRAAQLIAYAEAGTPSDAERSEIIARALLVQRVPPSGQIADAVGRVAYDPYAELPFDPEMHALLYARPIEERLNALQEARVVSPETVIENGRILHGRILLAHENDAVDYTNAIMLKNVGLDEPWRATYAASAVGREEDPVPFLIRPLSPADSPGFAAEEYDAANLMDIPPPPRVRPTQAEPDIQR